MPTLDDLKRDVHALASELGVSYRPRKKHICPFHAEKTGSLSFDEKPNGVWAFKCFGCGADGSIVDAVMRRRQCSDADAIAYLVDRHGLEKKASTGTSPSPRQSAPTPKPEPVEFDAPPILRAFVSRAARQLVETPEAVGKLTNKRGIPVEVADQYGLGWVDGMVIDEWGMRPLRNRWSIPVWDRAGNYLGAKLHADPKPENGPKTCWVPWSASAAGGNTSILWPPPEDFEISDPRPFVLVGGELKAMAIIGAGMPATSPTAGESFIWTAEEAERLAGRDILILWDDDPPKPPKLNEPPRKPANFIFRDRAINALLPVARSVKVATLGRKPDGSAKTDANDYAAAHGPGDLLSTLWQKYQDAPPVLEPIADEASPDRPADRMTLNELLGYDTKNDPNCIIGKRWLCKGGSCLLIGQTGLGKSALEMQMAILFALGFDVFGIMPVRPLKSVIIQAENDKGDLAEEVQGVMDGLGLMDYAKAANDRLVFYRETSKTAEAFCQFLAEVVDREKPDLIWVDPLLAFLGGDVCDQETVSKFLRNGINPILLRSGAAIFLLHHTNKPKSNPNERGGFIGQDFSYLGQGAAELSNWARAVISLREEEEGLFELRASKRGKRSGLKAKEDDLEPSAVCYLQHSKQGICWLRTDPPVNSEKELVKQVLEGIAQSAGCTLEYAEIIKLIAQVFTVKEVTAKNKFTKLIKKHVRKVGQSMLWTLKERP